ncbi:MAG: O-antigen ligase domain-containing protein [Candidatus Hydrogenedentes bacterium]|nr:O-antigen ligase domain-containing protein [Candidatus Hydrogenedentota bacterium]
MSAHEQGTTFVALMLFGWPLLLVVLYLFLPPLRATITAFIVAWLFLPIAEYRFEGLPEYNKMTATCFGAFAGTILFDINRIVRFRQKWVDSAALLLCLCPVASSLSNGLGLYDGLSESLVLIIRWGMPYFIGRIYFSDLTGLRELAIGIFIGGLIYVPLCWYELRFSPQLHRMLYGYHQQGFAATIRYGGYRPTVFLQHGLMVGMWMVTAALAGLALWRSKSLTQIAGVPVGVYVAALAITAVLCKSTGAIILLAFGLAALAAIQYAKTAWPVRGLAALYLGYVAVRVSGLWDGGQLVTLARAMFGEDRAFSLSVRIFNENLLVSRALQHAIFGWGGWGRSRIFNEVGQDITITDSQWVIRFGLNGLVGLVAMAAVILIPCLLLERKAQPRLWTHPLVAPAAAFAVILSLWMIDNTVNDMFNPIYVLAAGGLSGLPRVVETPAQPARVSDVEGMPRVTKEDRRRERKMFGPPPSG